MHCRTAAHLVVPCHPAVAGPEADLDVFGDEAQLYVLPANETLTFEHTYTWWGESAEPRSASSTRRACAAPRTLTPHLQPPASGCSAPALRAHAAVAVRLPAAGHSRRLRVTANPNITVSRAHVPWRCRWARVVLLGPLTLHDVDAASFAHHTGEQQVVQRHARGAPAHRMRRRAAQDAIGVSVAARTTFSPRVLQRPPVRKQKSLSNTHAAVGRLHCCTGFWERLLNRRQLIGLMAQGFQRDLSHDGEVLPLPEPSTRLLVSVQCHTVLLHVGWWHNACMLQHQFEPATGRSHQNFPLMFCCWRDESFQRCRRASAIVCTCSCQMWKRAHGRSRI